MNGIIFNVISAVADTSSAQQQQMKSAGLYQMLILVGIFVVMYFLLIRPQKKREKENEKLRSNIDIGDEIVTIGGIIGTVVSLKDEFVVIETSGDRNKIRISRWAIQSNNTASEREKRQAEIKKIETKK